MRKFLLIAAAIFMFFAGLTNAADVTLEWDAVSNATGYKLYMSDDMGTTWDSGTDVGNVTTYTMTNVLEDRLILWKIGAYNDNGESIAHWRFAGYDHRKLPLGYASGLGIE